MVRRSIPFLAILVGCTGRPPPDVVTWEDVGPLLNERCSSCHQPGGIGSFLDLTDGQDAARWAPQIAEAVSSGRMPPFPADGGCDPPDGFLHDPRLSLKQIEQVVEWATSGAQQGDGPGRTEPTPIASLDPVSATLRPRHPVRVPSASEAADSFICVLFDPGIDTEVWLAGLQVDPDSAEVTHHVQLNRLPKAWAEFNDAQDGTIDGSYPCFGNFASPNSVLLGGWIPGSAPIRYPEGSGLPVNPGQMLVARIHYHGIEDVVFDEPQIEVHWRHTPPVSLVTIQLRGNRSTEEQGLLPGPSDPGAPTFRIPAGARHHTETMRFPIGVPPGSEFATFLIVPHMHLAGTRMRAWLERDDGTEICLIDVPRYDFDWQLLYEVHPGHPDRTLRSGDSLRLECTYDNSVHNSDLAAALRREGIDEPIDITLGDGSLDEMCLLGLGLLVTRPGGE